MQVLLDIDPIKDDGITSCFDAQLQSYAVWKDRNYELMYIDNWQFEFAHEEKKGEGIWSRGAVAARLFFDDILEPVDNLNCYEGIMCQMQKVDTYYAREIVDRQLEAGYPTLICVDTYNIPWLEHFYGKIHSTHCVMIVGKNNNGEYYCNDTRPFQEEPIKAGALELERLFFKERTVVGVFSEHKSCVSDNDIREALLSNIHMEMFDKIELFADYVSNGIIDYKEFEGFDGGIGIILRAIRNIIRARCHYLEVLNYVMDKDIIEKNEDVLMRFQKIIKEWNVIKGLFFKISMTNKYTLYQQKIADKIREIAFVERQTAEMLKCA